MTELALQRLKAAGWTPGRKVDITPIEDAYADAGMQIPDKLREFFEEFGLLGIRYEEKYSDFVKKEGHYINPCVDFLNYGKVDYSHLLAPYGAPGAVFPVGFAHRGNMKIYYHENGSFYLFMEGGPLYYCGDTAESLFNGLIGGDRSEWNCLFH